MRLGMARSLSSRASGFFVSAICVRMHVDLQIAHDGQNHWRITFSSSDEGTTHWFVLQRRDVQAFKGVNSVLTKKPFPQ